MCIHGDKSQPERDWVLNGMSEFTVYLFVYSAVSTIICQVIICWAKFYSSDKCNVYKIFVTL